MTGGLLSFRDYVLHRKYDYGRGSAASWSFIAFARGDRRFRDVGSSRELLAYLKEAGASEELVLGARAAWNSFTVYRSRHRRLAERWPAVPAP